MTAGQKSQRDWEIGDVEGVFLPYAHSEELDRDRFCRLKTRRDKQSLLSEPRCVSNANRLSFMRPGHALYGNFSPTPEVLRDELTRVADDIRESARSNGSNEKACNCEICHVANESWVITDGLNNISHSVAHRGRRHLSQSQNETVGRLTSDIFGNRFVALAGEGGCGDGDDISTSTMESMQRIRSTLDMEGLCVVKGACPRRMIGLLLSDVLRSLKDFETIPMSMAERNRGKTHRIFLPVSLKKEMSAKSHTTSRGDFTMSPSSSLMDVMSALLSGEIGKAILTSLGSLCELVETTIIVSENGALAQDLHSDSDYAQKQRMFTVFVPLHDIRDVRRGPTRFVPRTHNPRCFKGGVWYPPSRGLDVEKVKEREEKSELWFPLDAGDAVVMDSCTWHRGGANTSEDKPRRVVLSMSFRASNNERRDEEDSTLLRSFLSVEDGV